MKKRKNMKYLPVLSACLIICLIASAGIAADTNSNSNNDQTEAALYDYNKYVYIDADAVAKECGALQQGNDPLTQTQWNGDVLKKALKKLEPTLHGDKIVAVMGHTPSWVLAAIACAAEPNQCYMFSADPNFPGGAPYCPIAKPELGKYKPEGHVNITFENDVESKRTFGHFSVINASGNYEDYTPADTLKVGLPDVPIRNADIFLNGSAPNPVAATVAKAYKDHCNSLWMKYHEEPVYTCVWSNSPNIKAGDQTAAALK